MTAQSLRIDEIASTMKKQKNGEKYKNKIKFFNSNKNLLETSFREFAGGNVDFIAFTDNESAQFFATQEFDFFTPFDRYNGLNPVAGMYWYDEGRDKWVNLDEKIAWYISLKEGLSF
jgi:hypothetical protein